MELNSLSLVKGFLLFQFAIVQIAKAQSTQTTLWPCKQWQYKARLVRTQSSSNQIMCQSRCKTSTSQCVAFVFEPGQGSKSCRLYGAFSANAPEVNFLAGGTICSNKITGDPPVIPAEGCEQKPGVKGARANKAVKVKSLDECKSKCNGGGCQKVLYRYSPADNAFYCDFFKEGGSTELRYFAGEVLCPKKFSEATTALTTAPASSECTLSSTNSVIEDAPSSCRLPRFEKGSQQGITISVANIAACQHRCFSASKFGLKCNLALVSYDPVMKLLRCRFFYPNESSVMSYLVGEIACTPLRLSPNEPLYVYTEPFPPKDCKSDKVSFGMMVEYEVVSSAFCFKLCADDPDCTHVGIRKISDKHIACHRIFENSINQFMRLDVQDLTICKIRSLAATDKAICKQWDLTSLNDLWSMDAKNSDECHARCFKFCEFYRFDQEAGKCFFYRRKSASFPEPTPIYSAGQVACSVLKTIQEPVIVDKSCPQIDIFGRRGPKLEVKSMAECYAFCEDDSRCNHVLAYQASSSSPIVCTKFQQHKTKGEKLKYYGNESICPRRTPPKKKELTCGRFEFYGNPIASLFVSSKEECEKKCTDFCDIFSFLEKPRNNVNCLHYDSWGVPGAKSRSEMTLLYFDQTMCSRNYVGQAREVPTGGCSELRQMFGERERWSLSATSADNCMLFCELDDDCIYAIYSNSGCSLVHESNKELQWTWNESVCPRKTERFKNNGVAPAGCRREAYFGYSVGDLTFSTKDECWAECQKEVRRHICNAIVYNVFGGFCKQYRLDSFLPRTRKNAIFLKQGDYVCTNSPN